MIRGLHAMFYSSNADELRAFFKDKLGFRGTDVGGGWLIFDVPEADLGVHPTEKNEPPSGTADISFYCDDIAVTVSELEARGVEFTQGGPGPRLWPGYALQGSGRLRCPAIPTQIREVNCYERGGYESGEINEVVPARCRSWYRAFSMCPQRVSGICYPAAN